MVSRIDGTARVISDELKEILTNVDYPLVFLFNNADNVSVWNRMQHWIRVICKTNDSKIHGKKVLTVFCKSNELINWESNMQKDAIIAQKDALNQQIIEEADAIIAQKNAIIEVKDAIIEEKDATVRSLRQQNNAD